MRNFLKRVLRFGVLVLLVAGFFRALNHGLLLAYGATFPTTVEVLIVGDSHARHGLDPSLIPGSRNVAQSLEPPIASSFKATALLRSNPHVHTLVVALGPHSLACFQDRLLSNQGTAREMVRRYYGIVPWWSLDGIEPSLRGLISGELRSLWSPNSHLLADAWHRLGGEPREDHPFVGAFVPRTGTRLTEEAYRDVVDRHFSEVGCTSTHSPTQEAHLKGLVGFARNRGTRVVLLRTPVHPRYRRAVPAHLEERFKNLWEELTGKEGVGGLDLWDLPLAEEEYFDFDHVSRGGTKVISWLLAEFLEDLPGPRAGAPD